ncbi:MAG: BMC domain-containing protein [Candidatus Latescibacterota bacterium]
MYSAIGLVEFNSIARGIEAADAMLKTAEVKIVRVGPICPGKYLVLVAGEVAAVQNSVAVGQRIGGDKVVDDFILPNVHPSVFPAILSATNITQLDALGVIETFSVASTITAADAAVKAASVELIEIRLAVGLGGKAFVTMTGDVSAVEAAVEAGSKQAIEKGMLVGKALLPSPQEELGKSLL